MNKKIKLIEENYKLSLIEELKKYLDKDWNRCKKDFSYGCFSCYAQLVWQFLTEWERQIEEDD